MSFWATLCALFLKQAQQLTDKSSTRPPVITLPPGRIGRIDLCPLFPEERAHFKDYCIALFVWLVQMPTPLQLFLHGFCGRTVPETEPEYFRNTVAPSYCSPSEASWELIAEVFPFLVVYFNHS